MEEELFVAGGCRARVLAAADTPAVQRLFDATPGYFLVVHGIPARPDEAQQAFDAHPPAWMTHGPRVMIGFDDGSGAPVAVADLLPDFLVPGVWHLGLLLVGAPHQGTGLAHTLYAALEAWVQRRGARWMRLVVVAGNTRAEAFWARCGYVEARRRHDVDTGVRRHTVRVCVKPLGDATLDDYLARMERDRPDSTSA
jgi:GNAT superfamily N-acetyltransferase